MRLVIDTVGGDQLVRDGEILLALCQPAVYRELVEESRWSPGEYEAWLSEALKEQLLPR